VFYIAIPLDPAVCGFRGCATCRHMVGGERCCVHLEGRWWLWLFGCVGAQDLSAGKPLTVAGLHAHWGMPVATVFPHLAVVLCGVRVRRRRTMTKSAKWLIGS
jgi:hypothetical protein